MQIEKSKQPAQGELGDGAQDQDVVAPRIGYGVYARPRKSLWQRVWRPLMAIAVIAPAVLATRIISANAGMGETLAIHVEKQQPVTIDLGSSEPSSPYVFGVNVFPQEGTQALDGAYGFMSYDTGTVSGLQDAGITMLRFPGGTWGEEHAVSYDQINAFLRLAQQTHATPLIVVRLAGSTPEQAAALVKYCNDLRDPERKNYPDAPFLPVHYWAIGNEPDLRGPTYTVANYVRDFISFATVMKTVDPSIKIFGPEISQYTGPTSAPVDSTGTPWLTGFLQGVAVYERAHNNWQILDGVSIHRYPFGVSSNIASTSLLFASTDEWRYALPLLQDQILHIMGTEVPIAITEINTSVLGGRLASPLATALWWADTLGTLLEEHVAYVDFFAARSIDQPYMLLSQSGGVTPLTRVMQLYTHMAADAIQVDDASGPVKLYAATNPARDTITLMLINESSQAAAISVDPAQLFSMWHSTRIVVPPYAVVCAVLHRGAGGQTFLYGPTSQMLATGQPGVITVGSLD
jgi:Glycoside hydrolase family 44